MRKGCIIHHHRVMIIETCRGKCLTLNTHANHHHIEWIQILVWPLKPQQIADFPICSGECCLSFTLPVHTLQFSAPVTHCISPTHFVWNQLPTSHTAVLLSVQCVSSKSSRIQYSGMRRMIWRCRSEQYQRDDTVAFSSTDECSSGRLLTVSLSWLQPQP